MINGGQFAKKSLRWETEMWISQISQKRNFMPLYSTSNEKYKKVKFDKAKAQVSISWLGVFCNGSHIGVIFVDCHWSRWVIQTSIAWVQWGDAFAQPEAKGGVYEDIDGMRAGGSKHHGQTHRNSKETQCFQREKQEKIQQWWWCFWGNVAGLACHWVTNDACTWPTTHRDEKVAI